MKNSHGILSTCLLCFLFLVIFYNPILFSPNDHMLSTQVDGLNNYYSFAYHIKHDKDYWQFDGMKYPFGETLQYVDAAPILSTTLKFISNNIVDISDYSVGIFNCLMLLSLILCALFFYLILRSFDIPILVSSLASFGITMLSTQSMIWLYGHYALSFSVSFPITWYLLIQFFKTSKRLKYSLLIAANTSFWFLVHNYLGMMALLFTAGCLLTRAIQKLPKSAKVKHNYLFASSQIILPPLFILLILSFTNQHFDRYQWPMVMDFKASMWSLLFPEHSFLKPIASGISDVFGMTYPLTQSWQLVGNYLGISTIIILTSALIYGIKLMSLDWKKASYSILSNSFTPYFVSSFILLLYAMAIPWSFGLGPLMDSLPLVNQFIGLGRFAWPFYYVATVFGIFFLFKLLKNSSAVKVAFIAIAFMILESWTMHKSISNEVTSHANSFKMDLNAEAPLALVSNLNKDQFQAIIPLPFYYKWNTPFLYDGTEKSENLSISLSYLTGIPLASAFLARPSISEGSQIISMFSPSYHKEQLLASINIEKPYLVLWTKEELAYLEEQLLSKCKLVYEHRDYAVFHIMPIDVFGFNEQEFMDDFVTIIDSLDINTASGYYYSESSSPSLYHGFNQITSKHTLRGDGAFTGSKDQAHIIYETLPGQLPANRSFNLSFWFYNEFHQNDFCTMWLEIIDDQNRIIESFSFQPARAKVFENGWALNEYNFILKEDTYRMRLRSFGENILENNIYIDELLIRPTYSQLYKIELDKEGKTNYIINNSCYFSLEGQ